jgi:hypothetical protein
MKEDLMEKLLFSTTPSCQPALLDCFRLSETRKVRSLVFSWQIGFAGGSKLRVLG